MYAVVIVASDARFDPKNAGLLMPLALLYAAGCHTAATQLSAQPVHQVQPGVQEQRGPCGRAVLFAREYHCMPCSGTGSHMQCRRRMLCIGRGT